MLFHTFDSQDERRDYGGSAFIEIQFCRLPVGTAPRKIVAVRSIRNWEIDSLYVDCESEFDNEYSSILDCGISHNLRNCPLDIYGINYFSPCTIEPIMERLNKVKPRDYEIFLSWLDNAKQHNGFYVLGI